MPETAAVRGGVRRRLPALALSALAGCGLLAAGCGDLVVLEQNTDPPPVAMVTPPADVEVPDAALFNGQPPPVLLNDPLPPVHTGGAPYPLGTFPPEAARAWDLVTSDLRQPASFWQGTTRQHDFAQEFEDEHCMVLRDDAGRPQPVTFIHIENQVILSYSEEPEDLEAVILEEALGAGVVFESISVRDASYYDVYDRNTFLHPLRGDNSAYNHFSALERLGGVLHPDAFATPFTRQFILPESHFYQVRFNGLEGEVPTLPSGGPIRLQIECTSELQVAREALFQIVGGLYTVFGDDVVLDFLEEPQP